MSLVHIVGAVSALVAGVSLVATLRLGFALADPDG